MPSHDHAHPPWAHDHAAWSHDGPPWAWRSDDGPRPGRWVAFAFALLMTGIGGLLSLKWMQLEFSWIAYACGVAAAVALLLIERWPGPGTAASGALAIAALLLAPVPFFPLVPLAFAIAGGVRRAAIWWAVATAAATLVLPVAAVLSPIRMIVPALVCLIVVGIALAISLGARGRRDRMRAYRASAEERRRTEAERERVRIARELHDVLAHSLSSISVQAGVALHLADTQPDRVLQTLRDIRETSTTALTEVRQVLGVLRGDEEAELAPEPDLDALPALREEATRLGLATSLDDRLEPRPAATAQLALYRILREAITNVARHAPGARVAIALRWDGSTAVAEIVDDGPRHAPEAASSAPGRGILGMRERAVLLGDTLEAGRRARGFAVTARIPAAPQRTPTNPGQEHP